MTNIHKFKNVSLKVSLYEDVKKLSYNLSDKKLSNARVIGLGIEALKKQISSSFNKSTTCDDDENDKPKIKP